MTKEEMITLNNYLQELNDGKIEKIKEKINLLVKQILLDEKFHKEMEEINKEISSITA